MKQLTLNIKDNKYSYFLELLATCALAGAFTTIAIIPIIQILLHFMRRR